MKADLAAEAKQLPEAERLSLIGELLSDLEASGYGDQTREFLEDLVASTRLNLYLEGGGEALGHSDVIERLKKRS